MADTSTIAEITKLVETYVSAMTRGNRAEIERIFFEAAIEVGHYQGDLLWNSREDFIRMCEAEADGGAQPFWAIRSLSVHGDIAAVHVENDWAGLRFDDILTLLRHEGAWRILSKAYYVRGSA